MNILISIKAFIPQKLHSTLNFNFRDGSKKVKKKVEIFQLFGDSPSP